jgi:hypothetical protein
MSHPHQDRRANDGSGRPPSSNNRLNNFTGYSESDSDSESEIYPEQRRGHIQRRNDIKNHAPAETTPRRLSAAIPQNDTRLREAYELFGMDMDPLPNVNDIRECLRLFIVETPNKKADYQNAFLKIKQDPRRLTGNTALKPSKNAASYQAAKSSKIRKQDIETHSELGTIRRVPSGTVSSLTSTTRPNAKNARKRPLTPNAPPQAVPPKRARNQGPFTQSDSEDDKVEPAIPILGRPAKPVALKKSRNPGSFNQSDSEDEEVESEIPVPGRLGKPVDQRGGQLNLNQPKSKNDPVDYQPEQSQTRKPVGQRAGRLNLSRLKSKIDTVDHNPGQIFKQDQHTTSLYGAATAQSHVDQSLDDHQRHAEDATNTNTSNTVRKSQAQMKGIIGDEAPKTSVIQTPSPTKSLAFTQETSPEIEKVMRSTYEPTPPARKPPVTQSQKPVNKPYTQQPSQGGARKAFNDLLSSVTSPTSVNPKRPSDSTKTVASLKSTLPPLPKGKAASPITSGTGHHFKRRPASSITCDTTQTPPVPNSRRASLVSDSQVTVSSPRSDKHADGITKPSAKASSSSPVRAASNNGNRPTSETAALVQVEDGPINHNIAVAKRQITGAASPAPKATPTDQIADATVQEPATVTPTDNMAEETSVLGSEKVKDQDVAASTKDNIAATATKTVAGSLGTPNISTADKASSHAPRRIKTNDIVKQNVTTKISIPEAGSSGVSTASKLPHSGITTVDQTPLSKPTSPNPPAVPKSINSSLSPSMPSVETSVSSFPTTTEKSAPLVTMNRQMAVQQPQLEIEDEQNVAMPDSKQGHALEDPHSPTMGTIEPSKLTSEQFSTPVPDQHVDNNAEVRGLAVPDFQESTLPLELKSTAADPLPSGLPPQEELSPPWDTSPTDNMGVELLQQGPMNWEKDFSHLLNIHGVDFIPKEAAVADQSHTVIPNNMEFPALQPLLPGDEAEHSFKYIAFRRIWTSEQDPEEIEAVAQMQTESISVDHANSYAEKLFAMEAEQLQKMFTGAIKFLGTRTRRNQQDCVDCLLTMAPTYFPSKESYLRYWVIRQFVSCHLATIKPPAEGTNPFIAKTVYAVRLYKLIECPKAKADIPADDASVDEAKESSGESSSDSDSDSDNDKPSKMPNLKVVFKDKGKAKVSPTQEESSEEQPTYLRTPHPILCPEIHTSLELANCSALNLQTQMSHDENAKGMNEMWQIKELGRLKKKKDELDGRNEGWKEQFNEMKLGGDRFEVVVETVVLCGPRNP